MAPRTEALLMAADRAQHVVEVVRPALDGGTWVVTDRYSASTLAYQGYGRGLDLMELARLMEWATGGLAPDLYVLVEVDLAVGPGPAPGLGRATAWSARTRGSGNGWRTATGDWPTGRHTPWLVVDGTGPVEAVAAAVWAGVRERLGGRGRERATGRPVPELFEEVVGQPRAVTQLMAAARRPVHAYLLHGPSGSGKRAAARGLAAALLCPEGGCGDCNACRRALAGTHPDLVVVERTGASISVADAQSIVTRAQRRPLEAVAPGVDGGRRPSGPRVGARPVEDGRGAPAVHRLRPPGRRPPSPAWPPS